jgi:hypothetical protein
MAGFPPQGIIKKVAHAASRPGLRKEREGRGTHWVVRAEEIKNLGYPHAR